MVVLPAPHGYDRSDKLIITLDYLQYETKSYLGVVVDLRFHLHHDHLASLGTGHQHRGVEQQLVAGLDAGVLVVLVRGILGAPGVLLAGAARELAGSQIILLPHMVFARNLAAPWGPSPPPPTYQRKSWEGISFTYCKY